MSEVINKALDSMVKDATNYGDSMSNANNSALKGLHSKIQSASPDASLTKSIEATCKKASDLINSGTDIVADAKAAKIKTAKVYPNR